jgi:hypothetical protein
MQVTICGLLVLLSFVLGHFKYRNVYVHVSDSNRICHVVREVQFLYVCVCVRVRVRACVRVCVGGGVGAV